ncbi:MAG TPA: hypothetical protein PL084_12955, partial [Chitinophagales bacterium]|nr:hypothetical protein [Chitinophagales bacterium]HRP40196.1 hypothetical protein [Chitinophagales bacterium]
MEGTPCAAFVVGSIDTFIYLDICSLPGFFQCDSFIAIIDPFIYNPPSFYPAFPHSGQTCLIIGDVSNNLKGTVTTVLSCSLKKNKKYLLEYWAANLFNLEAVPKHQTLSIWGYADTCVKVEQIWESEHIDTGWHKYTAILTPQHQDYEFIHFRIGVRDSVSRYLLLDSLSDIYPFNGNDVTT